MTTEQTSDSHDPPQSMEPLGDKPDPSPVDAARSRFSPLREMHRQAGRLASLATEVPVTREDRLYGPHGLKFPVLALLVNRHLGPVRHALAQRTVAGGMTVRYAPGDAPAEAD